MSDNMLNIFAFIVIDFFLFPTALYYYYRRQKAEPEKITWLLTYRNEFRMYLVGWIVIQVVFLVSYIQLSSIKL